VTDDKRKVAFPSGHTVVVKWPLRELGPMPKSGTRIVVGAADQEAVVVATPGDIDGKLKKDSRFANKIPKAGEVWCMIV
jgi:hypothetical protein